MYAPHTNCRHLLRNCPFCNGCYITYNLTTTNERDISRWQLPTLRKRSNCGQNLSRSLMARLLDWRKDDMIIGPNGNCSFDTASCCLFNNDVVGGRPWLLIQNRERRCRWRSWSCVLRLFNTFVAFRKQRISTGRTSQLYWSKRGSYDLSRGSEAIWSEHVRIWDGLDVPEVERHWD